MKDGTSIVTDPGATPRRVATYSRSAPLSHQYPPSPRLARLRRSARLACATACQSGSGRWRWSMAWPDRSRMAASSRWSTKRLSSRLATTCRLRRDLGARDDGLRIVGGTGRPALGGEHHRRTGCAAAVIVARDGAFAIDVVRVAADHHRPAGGRAVIRHPPCGVVDGLVGLVPGPPVVAVAFRACRRRRASRRRRRLWPAWRQGRRSTPQGKGEQQRGPGATCHDSRKHGVAARRRPWVSEGRGPPRSCGSPADRRARPGGGRAGRRLTGGRPAVEQGRDHL